MKSYIRQENNVLIVSIIADGIIRELHPANHDHYSVSRGRFPTRRKYPFCEKSNTNQVLVTRSNTNKRIYWISERFMLFAQFLDECERRRTSNRTKPPFDGFKISRRVIVKGQRSSWLSYRLYFIIWYPPLIRVASRKRKKWFLWQWRRHFIVRMAAKRRRGSSLIITRAIRRR